MKYVLALDVAKSKSMFMLSSDVGEVLLEPTEYTHNKSDFERIDSYISKLNIKDNLTVIMEATSIYHKAPERFFKENNYHVIVFNPLIGKEITNTIRKTKTDKQDCIKLTNLFCKGSIPDRNYTEDEIYTKLNELSRQYYHLDEGLTRHKNRYKELLHLCFPEFELCFKDGKIYDLTALNFIKEFPHAYIKILEVKDEPKPKKDEYVIENIAKALEENIECLIKVKNKFHYLGYFEDERAIGTKIELLKLQNTTLKKYIPIENDKDNAN